MQLTAVWEDEGAKYSRKWDEMDEGGNKMHGRDYLRPSA
jgi:hypothetical protein